MEISYFCDVIFYDVIFISMNIQPTENEVIWEENNSTEPEKNCSNNNGNVPQDTINDIKNDSTKSLCDDIGKKERRRLQNNLASKRYYLRNKDIIKLKGPLRKQKFRLTHKDYIRKYHTKYCNQRRRNDICFNITCGLRIRLNKALERGQKTGSAVKDLGCSIEDFKTYIENKFLPGMSWNNRGRCGWHLDHVIPLSSFDLTDRTQFLKACHYTNLQPLWSNDNIKKETNLCNFK